MLVAIFNHGYYYFLNLLYLVLSVLHICLQILWKHQSVTRVLPAALDAPNQQQTIVYIYIIFINY